MAKQFQKDLTSVELKTAMNEGRRLSSLTPKTKAWIQGRLLEDTSVKPKTNVEKAADSMTKTGGGLLNWAKNNPGQAALLLVPGAIGFKLAGKAGTFISKKYGPKAAKKVKEVIKKKGFNNKKVRERYARMFPQKKNKPNKSVISKKPEISGVEKLKKAEQKVNNKKQTKSVTYKQTKEDETDKFIKKQRDANLKEQEKNKNVKINKNKKTKEKDNKTKSNNKVKTETKPKEYTAKETMKILEKKKVLGKSKITQADKDKEIRQIVKNAINQVGNKTVVERGKAVQFIETTMRKAKASKSDIDKAVKQYRNTLVMSKKGGLIKKSIGGKVLKNIPAGNKGLPNLPTNVRNDMGYKKKGGIVRRNKGGFLGVGKALRGQGAVMRKKGGKIAY